MTESQSTRGRPIAGTLRAPAEVLPAERKLDAPALPQHPSARPSRIRQLPTLLVNQIAAGEVIERPASVVKELVENALDAGATRIDVRLESGGIELVRVADNGNGMTPDELPLALTPHATSKIAVADDLDRIATLGFRGEAIASIASVSRMTIRSRWHDGDNIADSASEIHAHGDRVEPVRPSSGAPGTVIEVRNLFFNTPARRKFLRTPRTEQGRCLDWLKNLAMAHPGVAVRVETEGRVLLDVPPNQTPADRVLAILGKELAPQMIEVSADLLHDDRGVLLWGLVGRPEIARPTATGQHVFLNGRVLRDRTIQHAFKEAYRGLIEPGRHPTGVLMLEMAPGGVDVNVHPAKLEVRFRDPSLIHTVVLRAVRGGLERNDLTRGFGAERSNAGADAGGGGPADAVDGDWALRTEDARQASALFGSGLRSTDPGSSGNGGDAGFSRRDRPGGWSTRPASDDERAEMERLVEALRPGIHRPMVPREGGAHSGRPGGLPTLGAVRAAIESGAAPEQLEAGAGSERSGLERTSRTAGERPVMQLHDSFLVAEDGDGLLLVDQHALHERVMFETLRQRLSQGALQSQALLRPIPIEVGSDAAERLDDIREPFASLGFELESLGPGTVGIRAAPTLLVERGIDPREVVEDFLLRLAASKGTASIDAESVLHEVLDTMSCKAAVKAGDPLTPGEIRALLELRETVERTTNCPHGRPTSVRLTRRDLERLFERR